jgi:hypothetical protein
MLTSDSISFSSNEVSGVSGGYNSFFSDSFGSLRPVVPTSMPELAMSFGQMMLFCASSARISTDMGRNPYVLVKDDDGSASGSDPDFLGHERPWNRVEMVLEYNVGISVDGGFFPNDRFKRDLRQGAQTTFFFLTKSRKGTSTCRAVNAFPGDLMQSLVKVSIHVVDFIARPPDEEIVLEVADIRFDLALFLRGHRRCGVDFASVVSSQLSKTPVERRRRINVKRRPDDRGLEIIGNDGFWSAAEDTECFYKELKPGLRFLIEDDAGKYVAAVAKGHDKDPGLPEYMRRWAEELAYVAEVDLSHVTGHRFHRDDDIFRLGWLCFSQAPTDSLDGVVASREAVILKTKSVIDRSRTHAIIQTGLNGVNPVFDARLLLRRCGRAFVVRSEDIPVLRHIRERILGPLQEAMGR